jgi:hypothetical protein
MSTITDKQSYSADIIGATVRFVKSTDEWLQLVNGKRVRLSSKLLSQARLIANGASSKSIHRWLDGNMDEDDINERLGHRGRKRAFTENFKKILVGRAMEHRLELSAVSAKDLINFSIGAFNNIIHHQRVSEILNNYGFSSQLSVPRNSRMVDEKVVEDSIEFILALREHRKFFKRLLAMDETGIWSNVVQRLTYHFRNQYVIH